MPKETVVLTEFIEGHQSEKSGKWVPAKVKDNRGRDFTFSKDDKGKRLTDGGIVGFIGELADIEFTESQNGKYTNRVISEIAHRQEPGPQPAMATPPPAEKQGSGWKRDPAESSLILRQVALKAAVEYVRDHDMDRGVVSGTGPVLAAAEVFNDWLHGVNPEYGQKAISPEQAAAQEATRTGGRYDAALANQKPHVAATLPPGKSLADAAREAVANHDVFEDPNPPHPADTVGREMLRPSRGAVR